MHTRFDTIFRVSVILKGLDAALEIISGALLLYVSPHDLTHAVDWLTQRELTDNPNDFTTSLLVHASHASHNITATSTLFGGVYLLSHGLIKIFVVINVLRNKYWAYPLLIVVLLGFVVYQIARITHTHSITLIALTIFDLLVTAMAAIEWQKQRALRHEIEASEDSKPPPAGKQTATRHK